MRRIVGADAGRVGQRALEGVGRRNVGHQHAVAHRDPAGGAAEIGAACGIEPTGFCQLVDRRNGQQDDVRRLAAGEPVLQRTDGVEDKLHLMPGGAYECWREIGHGPFDGACA